MSIPQLPLEILLMIARLLEDDDGGFCFANFNSFLKVNRVLHSSLNRTLWQQAVGSNFITQRVFTHLLRTNNVPRLKFFLELGADVETLLPEFDSDANDHKRLIFRSLEPTPLKVAAHLNNVPMARLLLEHGADVVQYDESNRACHSAIHAARSAEMVQLLLDHHANPEQVVGMGYRPIHYYAMRNNIEAMRAILRNGAEVNPLADLGRFDTPLHEAATRSIDAVKLLLEYGADVKKGDSRLTPLHLATKAGKSDVVGLLAKTWPDGVKLKDQYGRTSLHIAVQMRYIEVVRILLESCPEAMRETASFNGDTVLHEAAWMGTIDMVRLLMERCPEAVKEKNKYGQTPLHLAVGNHPGVIRFLVESWPEGTMEKNDGGNTPLHLAAWRGGSDEVVMRLFVEYWPASKEALNVDGKTPLLVFEEKYPEEEEEHSQPGLSQRQRIIALLGCVH